MKRVVRLLLFAIGCVLLLILVAFAMGATLPQDHSVTVTGTVNAAPDKTFAILTDVGAGNTWRSNVKSVEVLPRDHGRDTWIEDLGGGMKMTFVATTTVPPGPDGHGVRKVLVKDENWGGTWTYDLTPGPSANTTTLKITEDGFIKPPIYRFVMQYVFTPTHNLKVYLRDIQARASK